MGAKIGNTYRLGIEAGVNYLELENEYSSAKVDVFGHFPETISIEFLSAITISQQEVDKLSPETVVAYLESLFAETASRVIASNFKYLDDQIAPSSLRNDIILITKSFKDERNDDFYMKKLRKEGYLTFKFEVYIHTINAIQPNTLSVRFFNDQERESDSILSLRDFIQGVMSSPILTNNEKFKAERFVRGKKTTNI
jgi:hypothetical protein